MNDELRAWWGDPDLKARVVAKMKQHRAQDEFIQGDYQRTYGPDEAATYKGCAIGCTLPYLSREEMKRRADPETNEFNWHKEVENEYGISRTVARLIDNAFEAHDDFESAGDFAVAVIEAIPVGADLSGIACVNQTCGQCLDCTTYVEEHPDQFIELLAKAPVPE